MTAVTPSTAHRLRVAVARAQARGRLPSVVAGLVREGELAWSDGYGDVPGPVTDTQYRIGSITKTLTAVLVLQLVRDGALALDAPASAVIGDVGYADRSIRTLLAHSAGIQAEPVGSWWERSAGLAFDELAAANDGSGAVFPALQQFHYSNLGYALLGEVIARVHGATWWDCVRERVLRPLGMTRTSYLPSGTAAQGYSVHPYAATLLEEPATDTGAMAPAGQLWSTLADLASYASFLVDGHPDVLGREELLLASHPQSGDRADALGYVHGLGFQLYAGGSGMLVGHTGSMPGFLACVLVDRDRRTGGLVLANATTGLAVAEATTGLLEELESCEPALPPPWRPTTVVPRELADALGVWHWGNTALAFVLEDGELVARREGAEKYRFRVVDGRVIGTGGYHTGEELHVVRRPDGSVSHLDISTFIYTRVPYDPAAPIPGGAPG